MKIAIDVLTTALPSDIYKNNSFLSALFILFIALTHALQHWRSLITPRKLHP